MTDLTKNEKPFGLMTPEDKEALKAWPHGWEAYSTDGTWLDCGQPIWSSIITYRAKPAPAVEKRTLHGSPAVSFGEYRPRKVITDTHRLTFDVVDGEPVEGSERWERLDD